MLKICRTVLVLSLLPLTASCSLFDSKLVSACEEIVKGRLKSPSSYKRINVAESEKDISLEHYKYLLAQMGTPAGVSTDRLFQSGSLKPKELTADIDYDADNSFGAAIRGTVECKVASSGKNDAISKYFILVDGETEMQRLNKALSNN